MNPTISIITVTYNAAGVLERTLASVAAQTYPGVEHVLVDGASTDSTPAMIERYAAAGNCKWVSEPDGGLYDAMNKGLRMATGDYVWFLNAGDSLCENTTVAQIAAQLSTLSAQCSIIYGETNLVDGAGAFLAARRLKAPERLTWRSFRMGMLVCHQAFVALRSEAPEFDLRYRFSADFDWCIRCLKSADRVHNAHLTLCNYLSEGLTTKNRKASLRERFQIMARYYGWLPTVLRHAWFALRFYAAKALRKPI